jgi:2-dehydro-3-deoxyphosphogluconate aldolase / (4S)-4-hydroxy-2-oxoglutarate aldolase
MARIEVLQKILQGKIVAIIRTCHGGLYSQLAEALLQGGVTTVEVSLTSVEALPAIEELAGRFGREMQIGVGSVVDTESLKRAHQAGAQYIVTPVTKASVIEVAHQYDLPIFSGAFSPGEILQAHEWGADVVKVFPAETLGIPYFKAIKAPMPQLNLMPTGGVSLQNAGDWIRAGACALGVGSTLFNEDLIAEKNFSKIRENASRLVSALA